MGSRSSPQANTTTSTHTSTTVGDIGLTGNDAVELARAIAGPASQAATAANLSAVAGMQFAAIQGQTLANAGFNFRDSGSAVGSGSGTVNESANAGFSSLDGATKLGLGIAAATLIATIWKK